MGPVYGSRIETGGGALLSGGGALPSGGTERTYARA